MAQLRERAAGSEARLAALQCERDAQSAELQAARSALAEALEHLDGEDAKAQARRAKTPVTVACTATKSGRAYVPACVLSSNLIGLLRAQCAQPQVNGQHKQMVFPLSFFAPACGSPALLRS